jgi:cell division protein FtsW
MTIAYQPHAFARTDRSWLGLWWWTTDRLLLGAVALLIGLGVMLSFGSSPAAAARIGLSDPFHFAVRQCFYGSVAAVIVVAVSALSP